MRKPLLTVVVVVLAGRSTVAQETVTLEQAVATFAPLRRSLSYDRNGAVTSAELAASGVTDRHFAVLRAFPYLSRVTVRNVTLTSERLRQLQAVAPLQDLTIDVPAAPGGWLREVAQIPNLRILYLRNVQFPAEELVDLAAAEHLESLALPTGITDEGLVHLKEFLSLRTLTPTGVRGAGLRHLAGTSVTALSLGRSPIREEELGSLAELVGLRTLSLSGLTISDVGLVHVGKCAGLQELWLNEARNTRLRISDQGLAHLGRLTELRALHLMDCPISDAGLAHLAPLTKLEILRLTKTDILGSGLAHLRGAQELSLLELSRTKVGDAAMEHIGKLRSLEVLGLEETSVGDAGLSHLSQLNRLRILNLEGSKVTDAGLAALSNLTALETLQLAKTEVSDAGLPHLYRLANLKTLSLFYGTKVSRQGYARLCEALPATKISWTEQP